MFEKIREIIANELEIDESDITLDSIISEDLGIDSMDYYNLLDALEDNGIQVPEGSEFVTVGDIVKMAK